MKKLDWRRGLILVAFLLAVSLAGLFTVRAVRHALYWQTHHDETIRPWMSVGYVARSYRVPAPVLYRSINLDPIAHDRRPLREIAHQQNRPVANVIGDLQKAITDFRAHPEQFPHPPPNDRTTP